MKTQPFNIAKAIPAAWKLQWSAKQKMKHYRGSMAHYLTAGDIENQVRLFAEEQSQRKPWGSSGPAWGRPYTRVRIHCGHRERLLDAVRDWLRGEVNAGKLASHNFGRGHISGERYRPAGVSMSETEKKTIARKQAPRPIHFNPVGAASRFHMLCRPPQPRKGFGRGSRRFSRCTQKQSEVTCPRCLKKMKEGEK